MPTVFELKTASSFTAELTLYTLPQIETTHKLLKLGFIFHHQCGKNIRRNSLKIASKIKMISSDYVCIHSRAQLLGRAQEDLAFFERKAIQQIVDGEKSRCQGFGNFFFFQICVVADISSSSFTMSWAVSFLFGIVEVDTPI